MVKIVSLLSGAGLTAILIWLYGQAEARASALVDAQHKVGRLRQDYNAAVRKYVFLYKLLIGVFIATALYKTISVLYILLLNEK